MPADDPVEQLDSGSFDPENSHTIADFRPDDIKLDARILEHLAANGTSGSENEHVSNNLVENWVWRPSADMGIGSTEALSDIHFGPSRDSSTEAGFDPQPVNHGQQASRLADSPSESDSPACWQNREPRLNPASRAPTTTTVF